MEKTSRTELKLPTTSILAPRIEEDIKCFLTLDKFILKPEAKKSYRIRSLYFDSLNNYFYREKLAGVSERVKLRIRTYFPIKKENVIFIEIKYKNNIKQKKMRSIISYDNYQLLLLGKYYQLLSKNKNDNVLSLFVSFVLKYGARPKLCIDYDRKAYVSQYKSHYMRATFDTKISFQLTNDLFTGAKNLQHLVDKKYVVLELKFENNIPFWMQGIIRKYNLRVSAISKYALATRRLTSQKLLSGADLYQ